MPMKTAALALATGLLMAVTGARAEPPSTASIDRLLVVTQSEKVLDTLFGNMKQMMRQSLAAAAKNEKLSPEQERMLDTLPDKFVKAMREEMAWDKLRPVYAQIYQETFTQADIDGLIAFYESPTGQAFVEKMPVVVQKTAILMQSRMGPLMQKLQAAVAESVAEAKKAKP